MSCAFLARMTSPEFGYDTFFGSPDTGDLEEIARTSVPTTSTVRIRAFYAVELLYSEVISRQLFAATATSIVVTQFLDTNYPRSSAGLKKLAEDARRLHSRLSAMATVSILKKDRRDASLQSADIYNNVCLTVNMLLESIDTLTGCLRRDDAAGIGRIGAYLAEAMDKAAYPASEMESHLRTMLRLNLNNAISPWQKK